jgi:hypothetical protein
MFCNDRDSHFDITKSKGEIMSAFFKLSLAVAALSTTSFPAVADESAGIPLRLDVADADTARSSAGDTALLDSGTAGSDDSGGYFENWFARVEQAQSTQPHWMTPLVTVTPRLEQEVRYDQYFEDRGNGSSLDISDSGKGLELIPTGTNEVLINPPAWQDKRNVTHPVAGWLDDQFLIIKQRLASANEDNGNYIVTTFLGVTAPSGNTNFTNHAWIVTPTLAGGMGWGDFDIQATTGVAFPFRNQSTLGTSIATNIAFQYHLWEYFWPEFEINHTYWANGNERGGKNQVLLTPGLILGRFVIHDRVKVIIGAGHQFAVSPRYVDTSEQTPAYNRSWIMTARLTF